MYWNLDNNYFSLFANREGFAEANRCLCSLATNLDKAVREKDWNCCAELAQLFDKYQDKYISVGASDTEPRIKMSEVVTQAAQSMDLTDDEHEMADKVVNWFRWWYHEETEV